MKAIVRDCGSIQTNRWFVLNYRKATQTRWGITEGGWFVLKRRRIDTNEVGQYEVTVTSGLTHKQKEQRNRKEKRRLHAKEAQTKTQNQRIVLHFRYIRHERPWPTT